ncbi:MAG: bifunctional chorismate-binding protein/class IV aminotransferase, partial [Bdellovibrionales bacterium]|nr:bifunctional chorismate-binding protein/class IV aminotransferase [Bdellovibrionales bacterium]
KGTMARAEDSSTDQLVVQQMKQDEKIISENLMIVDMIRNDLTRIAQPGTVKVDKLFSIETYKTIHQMTSTVSADVAPNIGFKTIINNIFPCASITGAPKKRTMEIIQKLESAPRNIYTGAIGYIKPNNDMCLNVPIRTIVHQKEAYSMGLGGGVLYDSNTASEYQEIKDKAQFLHKINNEFFLFETMLFDQTLHNKELHLNRMRNSAKDLDFIYPEQQINKELSKLSFQKAYRLKLCLFPNGQWTLESQLLESSNSEKFIRWSPTIMRSTDKMLQHKNSLRDVYDKEWKVAQAEGFYDIIYTNENNHVTEASRHNIFIEKNGQLFTPPLHCGVLPGVLRQKLLSEGAEEKILTKDDLLFADRVFLTNALRGKVEVQFQ